MGADNYTICPACQLAATEMINAWLAERDAAYGKIPFEEFMTKYAKPPQIDLEPTFEENYELGLDVGHFASFSITYKGHCAVCGFSYTFKLEEKDVEVTKTDVDDAIGKLTEHLAKKARRAKASEPI